MKTQNIALDICMKQRYANLMYEYAGYQYYAYLIDRYNRLVFDYYQLQSENQRLRSENEWLKMELQQEKTLENTTEPTSLVNSTGIPSDILRSIPETESKEYKETPENEVRRSFQHQSEVIQQLREGGYLQKKRDKKSVQMCFAPIAETDENTPENTP